MKFLGFITAVSLLLPGFAYAFTLDQAITIIHYEHSGKLIKCRGMSDTHVIVALNDGTNLSVENASMVQVANSVCDLNKSWTGGPSDILCIAK